MSFNIIGSIPGSGIKVPNLKTIKARTVNHNLFCNSSAFEIADISIPAANFSESVAIFILSKQF